MVGEEKNIGGRIAEIKNRIAGAARHAGRTPESVKLVAVSKFHPVEMMIAAEECGGVYAFGESRVQEALEKRAAWHGTAPWHMIGHLQKNKARKALETFDLIESVDDAELAETLDRILKETERRDYPIFIEVNTSGEESKNGVHPAQADGLVCDILARAPSLRVAGLMTIGPRTEDEAGVRRSFAMLRELAEYIRAKTGAPLPELSMGMSGDFEIAIEEGGTMVRVGTAIFGERVTPSEE